MLAEKDFAAFVARHAGVDAEQADSGARLGADLGLDSFALLELHAAISGLGVDLSERAWLRIGTVGELYDQCLAGSHRPEPVTPETQPPFPDMLAPSTASRIRFPNGPFTVQSPDTGSGAPNGGEVTDPAGLRIDQRVPPPTAAMQGGRGLADPTPPRPPQRSGRYFRLAPLLPASTPFLYELAISPETGFRWRYRGSVPSYAQFEQELWQGMLSQFLVESVETGEPVGNVICYNPDFALGHAYVGAAVSGRYTGSGIAIEPVRLFIRYVFDVWPFRKLYFELPEFNLPQFASALGNGLRTEGRLVDHEYYQGRYWDRLILAVYRDRAGSR
ncbi:acetyltransferase, ribosomal protein N-acetylase [Frankia torreyi]|uniref:Acetyltransferase, ribosomal protein N-acetylase n=2 Tax=Frankia TaxID=1854 RepID=A0A0D8BC77_9ACTN|nr:MULTISPECIES: hypothetical protein [Frankia]KJE20992.1 acetyltransferase, ribosomal protein N-acetylase [Frankia torreyi]KQC35949.1 hypothetical protein UK82_23740 [Frankia sp. ACN1ag]KQM03893.1 acetyltransferase, ribosomal protein N-acetylase [Frankia sp. CpI1-P]